MTRPTPPKPEPRKRPFIPFRNSRVMNWWRQRFGRTPNGE